MAKRYQPLKEFGRSTKKPKLEVSVNKGPSTSKAAKDNVHNRPREKETFKESVDLWDEFDYDDDILLATQVAETEITASKVKKKESPMEITDSEITFSEFEPKIVQHSTQQQQPATDLLSQIRFDEDDEDIASLAAAIEDEATTITQKLQKGEEKKDDVFKKPAPVQGSSSTSTRGSFAIDEAGPSSRQDPIPSEQKTDPSILPKDNLTPEQQVQLLMERLNALKDENSRLNKNLSEAKENMQAKTGETLLLRSELRQTKQKLDEFKMEKMFETETVNAESKNKIDELSKQLEEKEALLQLKNMERSFVKMRQPDETKQSDTTAHGTTADDTIADEETDPDLIEILKLEGVAIGIMDLTIEDKPLRVESMSTVLTTEAYEAAEEKYNFGKFNATNQRELTNLQRIFGKILIQPHEIPDELINSLTESFRNVLLEFKTYTNTLDFGYHAQFLNQHSYDFFEQEGIRPVGCLHLTIPIIEGEYPVQMRRYIALLASMCEKSSEVTHAVLEAQHEEKPILQIAIDAITIMGCSFEVVPHFTLLEAFALLLRSMLLHLNPDKDSDQTFVQLLAELLKQIVFTRPNPWILFELSYSLLDLYERFPSVLEKFCVNSSRETFTIDRPTSTYKFSNDSCMMQVYCGLLETAFPLYDPLKEPFFELQTKMCLNHVRFVYYCVTDPPEFIDKFLVDDDEDDDSDDESDDGNIETSSTRPTDSTKTPYETFRDEQPTTSKSAAANATKDPPPPSDTNTNEDTTDRSKDPQKCRCFEMLCLSVIKMVWLSLRQWLRFETLLEDERVGIISRVSIHLFHFLFCTNFLSCLFREDEGWIKHFMYLIVEWFTQHEKDLKFSEMQGNFLKKLKQSYIIPKSFDEQEPKLENITADYKEWCELTNERFDPSIIDPERAIKNLRLEEDIEDPEKFLAFMEKPNMDLETFEPSW